MGDPIGNALRPRRFAPDDFHKRIIHGGAFAVTADNGVLRHKNGGVPGILEAHHAVCQDVLLQSIVDLTQQKTSGNLLPDRMTILTLFAGKPGLFVPLGLIKKQFPVGGQFDFQ